MAEALAGDIRRRILVSLVLIAALFSTTLPPLQSTIWHNPLLESVDRHATRQVETALERALAAFALARVSNGVISMIQESRLTVSPGGVGMDLAGGQILDPLNDLIERFSWVMLVALTSLGVQRFLIEISPWLGIEILGSLGLLIWLAGLWLGHRLPRDLCGLGKTLLCLALVVRFAVPVVTVLNEAIYNQFLAQRYNVATTAIEQDNAQLRTLEQLPDMTQDSGWWDTLRNRLSQAGQLFDLRHLYNWLEQRSAAMIDHFLDLLVVFLLNSVLLPIAFLWALLRLFTAVSGSTLPARLISTGRTRLAPASDVSDQRERHDETHR